MKFFKYKEAPILVWNKGRSDFKSVKKLASGTRWGKEKVEIGLCSKVRSRAKPLPPELAHEVIEVYKRLLAAAPDSAFASTYDEALPYPPPSPDRNREATYQSYISSLEREADSAESVLHPESPPRKMQAQSRCGRPRRQRSRPRTRR